MLDDHALLRPVRLGPLELANRVFLAPMTRMRASEPGNVPTEVMRTFYTQRASAGLIFTEGTQPSAGSKGYARTPGIYSGEQTKGWKEIVDGVHLRGGRICLQLLHAGRVSHPLLLNGRLPGSASALPFEDWVTVEGRGGAINRVDCLVPRSLGVDEIVEIVDDYHHAARNAVSAGFDFIEIHAAHGYLLHQFLSASSNKRLDAYGGSIEKRSRLCLEVIAAAVEVLGAQRVGLRVSPYGRFCGLDDTGGVDDAVFLARRASELGLAWLHVSEPDWTGGPPMPDAIRRQLRAAFPGVIVGAGGYDREKAERMLAAGLIDAVAFGRTFLSNPDLPLRLATGRELTAADPATFYSGGASGYIDYPRSGSDEASSCKALV